MSNLVYKERNLIVQLLAVLGEERGWKVETVKDGDDWHILYLNTEFGQLSWHIPSDELKVKWPEVKDVWDGHSTMEKYSNIERMINTMVSKHE